MLNAIEESVDETTGETQLVFLFTEGRFSVDSPVGMTSLESIAALKAALDLAEQLVTKPLPSEIN